MGRLTFDGVTKQFDDVAAATEVTLDIPDGEFAVIVGPSGCGKTTLLRMVAGLERPTEGTIALDGRLLGFGNRLDTGMGISKVLNTDPKL